MPHALIASLVVIALTWSPPATAQPSEDDLALARTLKAEGDAAYDAKDYDTAVAAYKLAYEKSRVAGFLYNIAQSYRLSEKCQEALDHYNEFLPHAVERKDRVTELIAEMEGCVEKNRAAAQTATATRPTEPATEPATEPTAKPEPTPGGVRPSPPPKPNPGPPEALPAIDRGSDRADSAGRYWRWSGIAAGGLGVALLAVGIIDGIAASDGGEPVTEFADAGGGQWTAELDDKRESALDANEQAEVALALGSIFVAAGAGLYYIGVLKRRSARSVRVGGTVAPSSVGVTVSWDL